MSNLTEPLVGDRKRYHRRSQQQNDERNGLPHKGKSYQKANPVNPLKNRLRSVTRVLAHKSSSMPADQMLSLQREEAALRGEIGSIEQREHKSRMIAKYHKVRFFERRKAERRLKQAERRLDKQKSQEGEDDDTSSKIADEIKSCKIDLDYTLYYPLETRYVSLYAKEGSDEEVVQRENNMWQVVKQAAEENKLEQLRDGHWPSEKTSALKDPESQQRQTVSSRGLPDAETSKGKKRINPPDKDSNDMKGARSAKKIALNVNAQPVLQNGGKQVEDDNDSDGDGMDFFERE